jgi:hypothetical protein
MDQTLKLGSYAAMHRIGDALPPCANTLAADDQSA